MSADVTLTGTLVDVGGNPVQGSVTITLNNYGTVPPIISGSNVLATLQITVQANSSGVWSTSLYRNNAITPANTFYTISISSSGAVAPNIIAAYTFNTAGTFDLSSQTPVAVTPGQAVPLQGPPGTPGATGATGPTGAPGSSNVPWFDIQNYGGLPRQYAVSEQTKTCTTVSGSPDVTLSAAGTFANNDYIVIPQAGAACSISGTPSAPTAAALTVQGSQTLNYKVVGVDALGGLTAASSAGQVTNAPAIFGNLAVAISSISVTSDVCTVNFSSPINASANQTIHIVGVTTLTAVNGVWTIASAPTTSQITFAITTADGTGVTTNATGRISNFQPITAISRDNTGLITITTAEAHNYVVPATNYQNQNIIVVDGVTPVDLTGQFVIKSASGTTITCQTGILAAESGTVTAGKSTVSCFEYVYVTCPAYATNTVAYYIYSDSPNPGGSLTLIGKTMPGELGWKDWGPSYGGGYTAPAYVPTTPPSSAQNQLFSSYIASGGGTTSIVLHDNVTTSVSSFGTYIAKDDGYPLQLALNAAFSSASNEYGTVYISPPATVTNFPQYIINYPVKVPLNVNIIWGCAVQATETISFPHGGNTVSRPLGASRSTSPQFGIGNYAQIFGVASPLLWTTANNISIDGLYLAVGGAGTNNVNTQNGQYGLIIQGGKTTVSNCFGDAGLSGTSVPLIYNSNADGASAWFRLTNYQSSASSIWNYTVPGQHQYGPPVGGLLIHTSDSAGGSNVGTLKLDGICSFAGRGILMDFLNSGNSATECYFFGDGSVVECQSPSTPMVMFWGPDFSIIEVNGWLGDSSQANILANWCSSFMGNVFVRNCTTSGGVPIITGKPILDLRTEGCINVTGGTPLVGQTENIISSVGSAVLTTGSGTTDTITFSGITIYSTVTLTAMNAAAATMVYTSPGIYAVCTANTITFTHGSGLAGAIFSIQVSIN